MKFLLVTYPDSESGHPTKYVRDSVPEIKSYPGGVTTPTPEAISFKPGEVRGWNIADCAARSYDLEGMHFGTIAAGRIGLDVLRKLKPAFVLVVYQLCQPAESGGHYPINREISCSTA